MQIVRTPSKLSPINIEKSPALEVLIFNYSTFILNKRIIKDLYCLRRY